MKDLYNRKIDYMRISVTDLCNLRCRYCMPEDGIAKREHREILTQDEIVEIAEAAVAMGVTKIRITGGEPLVKNGIVELCSRISAIKGVGDLSMTTNGLLLPKLAKPLKEAGVHRLNISLDTLKPNRYREITRIGELEQALKGIEAAEVAGFDPIKINVVLIGGSNDDEIEDFVNLTKNSKLEVRFIELMPMGQAIDYSPEAFLKGAEVLRRVPTLVPLEESGGVAKLYKLPGGRGRVGLINPLSNHFCSSCNRIRLTAEGKLKPCLHSDEEISVRGLHGELLTQAIGEAICHKPMEHGELSATSHSPTRRNMNEIGG